VLTLYGIANCDTIKKTRRWLEWNNIPYHFHDYRKQGLDMALAQEFLAKVPLDILINKHGTTWRKLDSATQKSLNSNSAIQLIMSRSSMIRRPLLCNRDRWLARYDEDLLKEFCQ